jgi:hypothetical protein
MPAGAIAISTRSNAAPSASPAAPPIRASSTLSVSICCNSRLRAAPIAARTANSRLRAAARANSSPATLAQAIKRMPITAASSTSETAR